MWLDGLTDARDFQTLENPRNGQCDRITIYFDRDPIETEFEATDGIEVI